MKLSVFPETCNLNAPPYNLAKHTSTQDLTSYNRKTGQARFLLTDFEMQDFLRSHFILITVFLF